ncbi:MAG TPA: small ribosomal subunit Rsm22 family protein [Polyangia bacterium]|nr:small ribosomal subunit Rsm22 family protein [Polyangia bacterium]
MGTRYLADPELRRQYAEEIAPRTGAALRKILAEVYGPGSGPPARALDLGAGTGAAGAALRERFGAGLDIVAVDRVAGPGLVAADLERDVPSAVGRFDLIVAAHLLGELFLSDPEARRLEALARRVLAWTRELLAEGGLVVLVEPALRETSRALLGVRDRLLAAGLGVVAPCFWTGPCPARERERDWCHDAAPVPSSPRVDFSYLALRAAPQAQGASFRIVSDRLVEKGRLKIYACGPSGRHPFVRLDRAASDANAAFARLERGDVATIAGASDASDGRRVGEATIVTRRSSSG